MESEYNYTQTETVVLKVSKKRHILFLSLFIILIICGGVYFYNTNIKKEETLNMAMNETMMQEAHYYLLFSSGGFLIPEGTFTVNSQKIEVSSFTTVDNDSYVVIDDYIVGGENTIRVDLNPADLDVAVKIIQSPLTPELLNDINSEETIFAISLEGVREFVFSIPLGTIYPWVSYKEIENTEEIKNKLTEKYKEIWNAFNEKDIERIKFLTKEKTKAYMQRLRESETQFEERLIADLENVFSEESGYQLYSFEEILPHMRLVISNDKRMATMSVEKNFIYTPIFFVREKQPVSSQYYYYFVLDEQGEFVPVY